MFHKEQKILIRFSRSNLKSRNLFPTATFGSDSAHQKPIKLSASEFTRLLPEIPQRRRSRGISPELARVAPILTCGSQTACDRVDTNRQIRKELLSGIGILIGDRSTPILE
jgi:hypothetical protein